MNLEYGKPVPWDIYADVLVQLSDSNSEIERLREQLAACQADAERWKYWRKQWAKQQFGGEQLADPKELDAAIDAARGK